MDPQDLVGKPGQPLGCARRAHRNGETEPRRLRLPQRNERSFGGEAGGKAAIDEDDVTIGE